MKVNYNWLTAACLLASVPLAVHLLQRRSARPGPVVRFATFNASLHRGTAGGLLAELRGGKSEQARRIAAIVQHVQPDVLLLQEVDRDDAAAIVGVLANEYLAVAQDGGAPVAFSFAYAGPVNTGEPSGFDLDGDGRTDGAADAFGYGSFPGNYGMVLLSRHPILAERVRTFRLLPWSRMPDALRPETLGDAAWRAERLSSKSHWDVPIGVGDEVVHVLCSHPTPPAFDGPEDRNGRRNHDEIRFWVDYLTPAKSSWIVDDEGRAGGLPADAAFVLLGDLNCDPADGDGRRDALAALLRHERVVDPEPRSAMGTEQARLQWGSNPSHAGDPALDTADFPDEPHAGPGNLRVDYVLLGKPAVAAASGVFWPHEREKGGALVTASDHRLVWVDVRSR